MQRELLQYFPRDEAEIIGSEPDLTEIRIRAGKPIQLISRKRRCFLDKTVSPDEVRKIAVRMMEYSYYAKEGELSCGFFTLKNGCRVGVSGTYVTMKDGQVRMQSISSLCIRIAREIYGCGEAVVKEIMCGGLKNVLLLSAPGLGKTTLLRDTARLLSEAGYMVGIADERHEIAACREGQPTLNVGPSTDVADGIPKRIAMERLIRSMSPQFLVTDEIGNAADLSSVREAVRQGVYLVASAHGADRNDLEKGFLSEAIREGVFSSVIILKDKPGNIADIWRR